jgi:hypothetical protein
LAQAEESQFSCCCTFTLFGAIKHLVHCECGLILWYHNVIYFLRKSCLELIRHVEDVEVVNAVVDVCHGCVVGHALIDIVIGPGWFVCI